MEILSPWQKLSISELEEFEREFKLKLPQDYKDFMLRFNGGIPEPAESFGIVVLQIQPIKYFPYQDNITIEDTIRVLKIVQQILPEHFFPFAYDEGGNELCISLSEDDYGSVYMCYLDYGDDIPTHYLCGSFGEFINSFH